MSARTKNRPTLSKSYVFDDLSLMLGIIAFVAIVVSAIGVIMLMFPVESRGVREFREQTGYSVSNEVYKDAVRKLGDGEAVQVRLDKFGIAYACTVTKQESAGYRVSGCTPISTGI